MPRRIALIMAGGGGTRLWPASTDQRPKQLLDPLLGTPARSLLAQTAERLGGLVQAQDIWVVVGHEQLAGTRDALPEVPAANFVVEPMRRNTAPCIALSLAFIQHALGSDADDATLMVVPADHHVRDPQHMRDLLRTACLHAEVHSTIVALGIQPSDASTAFGYIERGSTAAPSVTGDQGIAVFPAKRFVEKPNAATARKFVESGVYSWNAGIFVMPLSRIDTELQRHCTALYAALDPVREAIQGQRDPAPSIQDAYAKIAAVPIDVAVMEKQHDLRMIPASIGWT
ncbi:MAG: mannose-1-phosphate guanylyltransferase, partial [Nannocystaceae bacterium]|nr:mannose-1-phosphate guanylyltransferase [Nannocystaceae bacterium]